MQTYYNRERKKGKHLTLVERCIIEANLKEKNTHKEIYERIGVSTKTIQREVKRGSVEMPNSDLTVKKDFLIIKNMKDMESWRNAYPRKQFSGKSADEVYKELFT